MAHRSGITKLPKTRPAKRSASITKILSSWPQALSIPFGFELPPSVGQMYWAGWGRGPAKDYNKQFCAFVIT